MTTANRAEEAVDSAVVASRRAARSRWLGTVGRIGLVAKGVSYALVGVLAIALATGSGGRATGRQGALEVFADDAWGKAVLLCLALGLAAYAAWRLAQAIFDRAGEGTDPPGLAKRVGYLGRAALYFALAGVAVTLLDGTESETTETSEARQTTAEVFDWPAGRWLVAAVGAGFLAAAVFNAYRALTQKFEEKWYVDDLGKHGKRALAALSSVGLFARFVVFGLVGIFLVRSAYEYDPQEAIGLDGALRKLADGAYGQALLGALAAGVLCYALFCFAEARYRRV
jgi:succinate dehydrogenase/fumarate reductase cytochrome b subunit